MGNRAIIKGVAGEVKRKSKGAHSGHDWWHIYRVWTLASRIGREEGADIFVVELAALLHDIADWKFHYGDETVGPRIARQILLKYKITEEIANHVCEIIAAISFKGAGVKTGMKTLEGRVVQDADRLDAIGALGIARVFAYGGFVNRAIHEPDKKPSPHQTKKEYFESKSATINHFYEKLMLLKDRMNTGTAKKIAKSRHEFMKKYLDRFFQEWAGAK